MCILLKETKRKSVIGYKVVSYKDDKIFSIFTGIEYKIGDVPKPKVFYPTLDICEVFEEFNLNDVTTHHTWINMASYGKTTIFCLLGF